MCIKYIFKNKKVVLVFLSVSVKNEPQDWLWAKLLYHNNLVKIEIFGPLISDWGRQKQVSYI